MSTKADYTEDEWKTILEAPTSAGLMVITASRGGTFRETFSMAKAYSEAREQHGASELLDAVVASNPKVERHAATPAELELRATGYLRDAIAAIRTQGTEQEVGDYGQFVLGLADRVAAHRSGMEVSDAERAAIEKIREAVGAVATVVCRRSLVEERLGDGVAPRPRRSTVARQRA
jgi:hypothetical protein